ncbi:hypothetical protein ACFYTQ_33425 [Nocardia sp. NPDC004068]|uniref:hypothetical protein n=1 Tax=Nocardia sp. NPDC004068 TaxID=3364303 RepID=UPI003687513B
MNDVDPNSQNPVSLNQIGDTTMTIQPTLPSNGHHLDAVEVLPSAITTPPAEAPAPFVKHEVPRHHIAWSLLGRGPIPASWLTMVLALVTEQWRIGRVRDADRLSNLEALVTSKGMAGATKARDRGVEQLGQLVDQAASMEAETATLRQELDRVDETPVHGMHAEVLTATEAEQRMDTVSAVVTEERDDGSLKHRRVPGWLRRLAPLAIVLDFPVLLYFIGEVFNVDWAGVSGGNRSAIGQSIVPLITSVVFALLGTAAVAIGLHFFGRDLKGYKGHDGHIELPDGKARVIPLTFLVLSMTIAVGAGVVMAYRIISDSLSAGGNVSGAAILGLFFSLIVIVLNVVVFSVHYRDGSLLTDEIDHLAGQLAVVASTRRELQRRIDQHRSELGQVRLKGERIHAQTLAVMGEAMKAADQVRLIARSYHQGCGAEADIVEQQDQPLRGLLLPDSTVDTSVLDGLLKQLTPKPETTDPAPGVDIQPIPKPLSGTSVGDSAALAAVDGADDDDLGGEW